MPIVLSKIFHQKKSMQLVCLLMSHLHVAALKVIIVGKILQQYFSVLGGVSRFISRLAPSQISCMGQDTGMDG